jgi:hypothetical protein
MFRSVHSINSLLYKNAQKKDKCVNVIVHFLLGSHNYMCIFYNSVSVLNYTFIAALDKSLQSLFLCFL